MVVDVVNGDDSGVIERGGGASLAIEPTKALGIGADFAREDFDGGFTSQLDVPSAVDLAHPAGTERRKNLVRA